MYSRVVDQNPMKNPLLEENSELETGIFDDHGQRIFKAFETPDQQVDQRKRKKYPLNTMVTSRYTIISFLPKSLFEQFRRLANVYFLMIGIIAAVGTFSKVYESSVTPAGILFPMLLVILISIAKEGLEDYKRHSEDKIVNSRTGMLHNIIVLKVLFFKLIYNPSDIICLLAKVISPSGNIEGKKWKDLNVGTLLLLVGNDEIPADAVVLRCGGIQGDICYVETAAIDGETNLKIRLPAISTQPSSNNNNESFPNIHLSQDKSVVNGIDKIEAIVTAEAPNGSIHRFNGSIEYYPKNTPNYSTRGSLSDKNLLLRGSVIRATEWCIAIVTYTGNLICSFFFLFFVFSIFFFLFLIVLIFVFNYFLFVLFRKRSKNFSKF